MQTFSLLIMSVTAGMNRFAADIPPRSLRRHVEQCLGLHDPVHHPSMQYSPTAVFTHWVVAMDCMRLCCHLMCLCSNGVPHACWLCTQASSKPAESTHCSIHPLQYLPTVCSLWIARACAVISCALQQCCSPCWLGCAPTFNLINHSQIARLPRVIA
jgi:hypothetical protein